MATINNYEEFNLKLAERGSRVVVFLLLFGAVQYCFDDNEGQIGIRDSGVMRACWGRD